MAVVAPLDGKHVGLPQGPIGGDFAGAAVDEGAAGHHQLAGIAGHGRRHRVEIGPQRRAGLEGPADRLQEFGGSPTIWGARNRPAPPGGRSGARSAKGGSCNRSCAESIPAASARPGPPPAVRRPQALWPSAAVRHGERRMRPGNPGPRPAGRSPPRACPRGGP